MRVAVISDVHSNLAALEAALADIDVVGVDEIWSLGDTTGYCARPAQCLSLVRERCTLQLAGNHDLVVCGSIPLDAFRAEAAEAARWSAGVLREEEKLYMDSLRPDGYRNGVEAYHASIRDPIWEYVLTTEVAEACLREQREDLALCGHSHVALRLRLGENGLDGGQAHAGDVVDLARGPLLLNPGSVGQPRDGDPRAAWLLLDLDEKRAEYHRTEYDIARTQAEILEAGLPKRLADRLSRGE